MGQIFYFNILTNIVPNFFIASSAQVVQTTKSCSKTKLANMQKNTENIQDILFYIKCIIYGINNMTPAAPHDCVKVNKYLLSFNKFDLIL